MEANLRGAQCRGSVFDQAIFVGATLEQADFSESRLFQSILQQVNAVGVRFTLCDLTYSDFTGADLRLADLRGATFPAPGCTGRIRRMPSSPGVRAFSNMTKNYWLLRPGACSARAAVEER
jgi:hypothetical protein